MNLLKKNLSAPQNLGKHQKIIKMKAFVLKLTLSTLLFCPFMMLAQWAQIGGDIDGEDVNDQSGYAISLSADGNTVAIGAPFNDGGGTVSGHVRVYENNVDTWVQKGSDINGLVADDSFGWSVSISADGNSLAVGAPDSKVTNFKSGQVRVFKFQGGDWVQLGNTVDGDGLGDNAGFSVSLSDDGSRFAMGAPDAIVVENVGSNYGQVRVYGLVDDTWEQVGDDINGDNPDDNSGFGISLNQDGTIIAVGAPNVKNIILGAGQVKIYALETDAWVQIGEPLNGVGVNDKFGEAVSLNNQGTIIAAGARSNTGGGQVRVFENQASTWVQLGGDLDAEATGDEFGISVSLNADGTVLAAGARYNSGFLSDAGHTRVFKNQSDTWMQIGDDIDGEALQDRSGIAVSLSADGSIVAIGAYLNNSGNGDNAGHVRLFTNANVLSVETTGLKSDLKVYPNPATTEIQIDLKTRVANSTVRLFAIDGKLLFTQKQSSVDKIAVDMQSFSEGIYILNLQVDGIQETMRVIKR